ncbi:pyridoxal phosphate-dependent aminotransferase [Patulibacter sp.]|uniref:pyridoxal phosphate-dependent aminotransferase n=1 Tax=Patulibacter sp. TaxID=1912859 RepID=UPI00272705BE|nr:pyridoxal phosphate-dependent aminotransferase [Patulibacter sp.]MDO9407490.1 pyridoxal phosphate-dependent aminotransferase [Patulibacter sp.]
MPHGTAAHLRGYGTTIFAEMTALAAQTGAVNLGQGFPDEDGPLEIREAAAAALLAGPNQYTPGRGTPELRAAVVAHAARWYGRELDADRQVQVTVGATEGVAAALLGLCEPGDAVVTFEPYYDSYGAGIAMAGAVRRTVPLRAPDFAFDPEALRAAVRGDGTGGAVARALILNSPHNPTGRVFTRAELEQVAAVCVEHDLVAICDEVYEHLAFDGEHLPLATLPGMAGRTLTVSSAGKTFALTGWKVGWVTGPPDLVDAVATAKQFLTFSGHGPLQAAVARALALDDAFFAGVRDTLRSRRDRLCAGLRAAGLTTYVPQGGYFATVDVASIGETDGAAFCRDLPRRCGVAGIPVSVFCDDPDVGRTLVRFAYCKREDVIDEAAARLATLAG